MSKEALAFRVKISSEQDEKLKQQMMEVLDDSSIISQYLDDLLEKHLGKLADIFNIMSSIKSYHLRNRIDPRFAANNLSQDRDELVCITKNNLLKVYKVFTDKDYVVQSMQSDSDIIQDIYRTPIMPHAIGSDCYQFKSWPTIQELIHVTDFFAICMQNAHMPFTYIYAARRSPFEKYYGELFRLFNIQDDTHHDELPSQPSDPAVANNKDAYSCYFLKWMLMYLNSFAITQYRIFSSFLPLLEKNVAQICMLLKLQLNVTFDHRVGSYIDEALASLPIEGHHIEPRQNLMEVNSIAEILKPLESNTYKVSLLLREIVANVSMSSPVTKQRSASTTGIKNDALKDKFESVKYNVRQLHGKRADMFKKLPGLQAFSEILLSSTNFEKALDSSFEEILSNYLPMAEMIADQFKRILPFGEWKTDGALMEYSSLLFNIGTIISSAGLNCLREMQRINELCLNQITSRSLTLAQLQSERAQQEREEELYKTPAQSPGRKSRSNSITKDQTVNSNASSPRLRADKSLTASGDTTLAKIQSRESSDKSSNFIGSISGALKKMVSSSSSSREPTTSPRSTNSSPDLINLVNVSATPPLPITQKPTG